MADIDPTLPQAPITDAPVVPETPAEQPVPEVPPVPTPPTAQEVEQVANQVPTPEQVSAEDLLRKFLSGQAVEAHPVIDIQIAPMVIKKMDDGGVVISPSGTLLAQYKVQ